MNGESRQAACRVCDHSPWGGGLGPLLLPAEARLLIFNF
jgi:hypothetical protein